ncbi:MAG: 30S ribosomal protein S6 [Proteobacteria bacterium]|nr:30S ribosomal protein S6 [Pseudomonadota bacterium]
MRKYETFYISDSPSDLIEKINARVKEAVEQNQGVFLKAENWGTRQLAYQIKGKQQGSYYRLEYELAPAQVGEINRALRFQEGVIRFRTHLVEGETLFAPYETSDQFAREPRHFAPMEDAPREVLAPAKETVEPVVADTGKAEKQEGQ